MQPRGLRRSRSCRLKCSETAAGQELASLSAGARQLPPLASGGVTFTGPCGRRFLKEAQQIESRFVIRAPALPRPQGGYATLIRGRHRANRISVIRGSVRAPLLSLISPKKNRTANTPPSLDNSSAGAPRRRPRSPAGLNKPRVEINRRCLRRLSAR